MLCSTFSYAADFESSNVSSRYSYTQDELNRFNRPDDLGECSSGNNKAISLFDEGNTLHNEFTQDQDGLGTCYANSASIVMSSYNPELPMPSYLDIASYNPEDNKNNYIFDGGWTCKVMETIKAKNVSLCENGLLENQPKGIQDKILYKLYDSFDKYGLTKEQARNILNMYSDYLEENPRPTSIGCAEAGKLNIKSYVQSQIELLTYDYVYQEEIVGEYTSEKYEAAELKAKLCSEEVKAAMLNLNILEKIELEVTEQNLKNTGSMMGGGFSGGAPSYKARTKLVDEINESYLKRLNDTKLPSGKTHFNFLAEILDKGATPGANYDLSLGDGGGAFAFQEVFNQMVKEHDPALFDGIYYVLGIYSDKTKSCLDQYKKGKNDNGALFFNTIRGECFKETQAWRNEIWNYTKQCSQVHKDLFDVFKTLTALGKDIVEMNKFIVDKNKHILRQIIDNHCSKKHNYKIPEKDCTYDFAPWGLGNISDPLDWVVYKDFLNYLDEYKELNKDEVPIDVNKMLEFLGKKVDEIDDKENGAHVNVLWAFKQSVANDKAQVDKKIFSLVDLKLELQGIAKEKKKTQLKMGKKIVDNIKQGHALEVGTCGALFSMPEKTKRIDCDGHAVTATGIKCVAGRLKVELTNSWGISCRDDKGTNNLFECQRDEDGITNGRSWVDYGYLSDMGVRLNSY